MFKVLEGPNEDKKQMIEIEPTKLLTIPQFARATGLTYSLSWQLVRQGRIPSVMVGTRRRIDARWIDQWLATGGYKPRETIVVQSEPAFRT